MKKGYMEYFLRLTPTEKELKQWYEKYHCLMPMNLFVMQCERYRKMDSNIVDELYIKCRALNPITIDYQNKKSILPGERLPIIQKEIIDIKRIPRYFPSFSYKTGHMLIKYVMSGACRIKLRNAAREKIITIYEKEIFFISENSVIEEQAVTEDTLAWTLAVDKEGLAQIQHDMPEGMVSRFLRRSLYENSVEYLVCRSGNDVNVDLIFQNIILEIIEKAEGYQEVLKCQIKRLLIYVQRNKEKIECWNKRSLQSLSSEMFSYMKYMEQNIVTFSLQKMAEHFNTSPSSISKNYKTARRKKGNEK